MSPLPEEYPGELSSGEHWPKERIREILAQNNWFAALRPDLQRSIINRGEIRHFRAGRSIYKVGDRVNGMYAALAGDFRSYATGDDGERMLMRLIGPGAWFGGFQLIEKVPARDFEFRTSSPCATLFLPTREYDAILAEDPRNYPEFVKLNSFHVRILIRIMVEARSNVERRTARTLLRIAKMHGRDVPSGVRIAIRLSQSDLASIVGVSRQYMNELLSRWNAEGLLLWKGPARPILCIPKLKNLLTPVDDWLTESSEGWA
jgi:CRP/FNR family transcriptional regulator, cyclic AMP receptor protein